MCVVRQALYWLARERNLVCVLAWCIVYVACALCRWAVFVVVCVLFYGGVGALMNWMRCCVVEGLRAHVCPYAHAICMRKSIYHTYMHIYI